MSGFFSSRSAQLALYAMRAEIRRVAELHEDMVPSEDTVLALAQLQEVAASATGAYLCGQGIPVSGSEQISVAEAAKRLGITDRAVRGRIAAGTLTAKRIGSRTWTVEWTEDLGKE